MITISNVLLNALHMCVEEVYTTGPKFGMISIFLMPFSAFICLSIKQLSTVIIFLQFSYYFFITI